MAIVKDFWGKSIFLIVRVSESSKYLGFPPFLKKHHFHIGKWSATCFLVLTNQGF